MTMDPRDRRTGGVKECGVKGGIEAVSYQLNIPHSHTLHTSYRIAPPASPPSHHSHRSCRRSGHSHPWMERMHGMWGALAWQRCSGMPVLCVVPVGRRGRFRIFRWHEVCRNVRCQEGCRMFRCHGCRMVTCHVTSFGLLHGDLLHVHAIRLTVLLESVLAT